VFAALHWLGAPLSFLIPPINRLVRLVYFKRSRRVGRSDHILNLAMPPRHQEMEYSIPVEHAAQAMRETRQLIESKGLKVNFIVELRFVAADDSWLSPAYERDSCYVGAYIAGGPHEQLYLDEFEKLMLGFGGRPHWGKEFKASANLLAASYPRMVDFVRLRGQLDPNRVFSNDYTERVFGP
jgi:FAD/FMN-containing dehydrogenase